MIVCLFHLIGAGNGANKHKQSGFGKMKISDNVINNDKILPIKMLVEAQPYMLMRKFGTMSPEERDIYRANMIRQALNFE